MAWYIWLLLILVVILLGVIVWQQDAKRSKRAKPPSPKGPLLYEDRPKESIGSPREEAPVVTPPVEKPVPRERLTEKELSANADASAKIALAAEEALVMAEEVVAAPPPETEDRDLTPVGTDKTDELAESAAQAREAEADLVAEVEWAVPEGLSAEDQISAEETITAAEEVMVEWPHQAEEVDQAARPDLDDELADTAAQAEEAEVELQGADLQEAAEPQIGADLDDDLRESAEQAAEAEADLEKGEWTADAPASSEFFQGTDPVPGIGRDLSREEDPDEAWGPAHEAELDVQEYDASVAAKASARHDNLRWIAGIGPKIAGLLEDAGIVTFAQLAKTDIRELQLILDTANVRLANPDTWPEQAALAAEARWDELATLQTNLKGGQRV
jgi:predicted flap endonuclease-1-like 5' DNA nuclease